MYLKTPYVLPVDDSPGNNRLPQIAAPTAKLAGWLTAFTPDKFRAGCFSRPMRPRRFASFHPRPRSRKYRTITTESSRLTNPDAAAVLVDVTGGTWLGTRSSVTAR